MTQFPFLEPEIDDSDDESGYSWDDDHGDEDLGNYDEDECDS